MAELLIDERFQILLDTPLGSLGGCAGFAAQDRRRVAADALALRAEPGIPIRAQLGEFMQARHEALLRPLSYGAAGTASWIIAEAPPGPSLASLSAPWSGHGLLSHVLRPAALALERLQSAGLTHRAIRPENVFVAAGGTSVVLGPCWTGPPAIHQPAQFEPTYSAVCAPAARGDGTIMDDVYALGVLLLALHTRALPLAGLEPGEIIQLKLEHGSYAALAGRTRLSHSFEEILRAMLADDPLARATPAALANLDGVHASRGIDRAAVRSVRPIKVGDRLAWNRRMLAQLCAEQPEPAMLLLRQGAIESWVRRGAEDVDLVAGLDELRQQAMLGESLAPSANVSGANVSGAMPAAGSSRLHDLGLMRLIALLDPTAPLFWRGRFLWPDALGPILAASLTQPPLLAPQEAFSVVDDLLNRGVIARWRQSRPGRSESGGSRLPLRLLRVPGSSLGPGDMQAFVVRLAYALNPYLSCASPKLAGEPVIDVASLVAALERLGAAPLLDMHSLAFLESRLDEPESGVAPGAAAASEAMRELELLGQCQALTAGGPRPRIAASLLPRLEVLLQDWPGVSRRQRRLATLRTLAASGDLVAMRQLLGDRRPRREDEAALARAQAEIDHIDAALAEQQRSTPQHLDRSLHSARDAASAAGMLCLMAMLLFEVLSR